ncbi:MAG TPA: outer membrane beta-barrel protein [Gammaproteobacteria bacterium]
MNLFRAMIGAALVLASGTALAQDDNTEGLYLGGGFGDFSVTIDDVDDVVDAVSDFDTDEGSSKYFVGYRFNRFLSVQGDLYDLGDSATTLRGQPISSKTEAYGASVVGTLPIGFVELFARAGVISYDLEVTTPNISDRIDQSDSDLVYSVGVGFTFVHRFNLQLEYEVLDISEFDDADAYWLNASWRF